MLLAALGLSAPANAAPVAVSAANWDLFINSVGFLQMLSGDCLDVSREELHWQDFNAKYPFKYTKVFEGVGIPVAGSFDPATKTGSIAGSGTAVRIDNFNAHARAIRIGAFGLKVNGGGSPSPAGSNGRARSSRDSGRRSRCCASRASPSSPARSSARARTSRTRS